MVITRRGVVSSTRHPRALTHKGNIGFLVDFLTREALAQKQAQAGSR